MCKTKLERFRELKHTFLSVIGSIQRSNDLHQENILDTPEEREPTVVEHGIRKNRFDKATKSHNM